MQKGNLVTTPDGPGVVVDIDRGYAEAAVKLPNKPHHLWYPLAALTVTGHDPDALVWVGPQLRSAGPERP